MTGRQTAFIACGAVQNNISCYATRLFVNNPILATGFFNNNK